jgi:Flp pilus assembly protein TadB
MKSPPRSPAELSAALGAIFPSLPRDFGSSGESVLADADPTYHSVVREFAYFSGRNLNQFSDRQLRRLADLIARCVAAGGPLANAFESCFLEQIGPLGLESRLRPFLAAANR